LFPFDPWSEDGEEAYKRLAGDPPSDIALLGLLDEVEQLFALELEPLVLFGYSGGGQFAHRFMLRHPQAVAAVSIGSPGTVTRLDRSIPWPLGLAGDPHPIDSEAIARVSIQTFVGEGDDLEPSYYTSADLGLDAATYRGYGRSRKDRVEGFASDLRSIGATVEHHTVPGSTTTCRPLLRSRLPHPSSGEQLRMLAAKAERWERTRSRHGDSFPWPLMSDPVGRCHDLVVTTVTPKAAIEIFRQGRVR